MDPAKYTTLIERVVELLDEDDCGSEDEDPRAATWVWDRSHENDDEIADIITQLVQGRAMYNAIDNGRESVEHFLDIFDRARFHNAWNLSYDDNGLDANEDHFLAYALNRDASSATAVILIKYYQDMHIIHEVMDEIIRNSSVDVHLRLLVTCKRVMGTDVFVKEMQGDYLACPIRSFMYRSYEPAMGILKDEFGMEICLKLASPPGPTSGSLLDNLITPMGSLYPGIPDDMRALNEFIEFLETHKEDVNMWDVFVYRYREGEDVFKGGFLVNMLNKTRKRATGQRGVLPHIPTDTEYTDVMEIIKRVLTLCQDEPHLCDKLILGTIATGVSALQNVVNMSSTYTEKFNVSVDDVRWYADRFYESVYTLVAYLTPEGFKESLTKTSNSILVTGETILHLAAQQPHDSAMRVMFEVADEDTLSDALDVRQALHAKYTPFLLALSTSTAVTRYMAYSPKISNHQLNATFAGVTDENGVEINVEAALRRDEETPGPSRFMISQETKEFLLNRRFRETAVKSARM